MMQKSSMLQQFEQYKKFYINKLKHKISDPDSHQLKQTKIKGGT